MEEFDIKAFGEMIKDCIGVSIPIEPEWLAIEKHIHLKKNPRNPLQLHQQVKNEFAKPIQMVDQTSFYFDLGSERLEAVYPYYHILEDAEVIHIRGKGTKTSKGSQASVKNLSKRDYARVERKVIFKDGKGKVSYFQEYRKNVRGKRSALKKETFKVLNDDGEIEYREKVIGTKTRTTYVNKNYHYIENNLENWIIPTLMNSFNLKRLKNGSSDIIDKQYDFLMKQFDI